MVTWRKVPNQWIWAPQAQKAARVYTALTKKRKKSHSGQMQAAFASSLPVFTGGLGTRNGSQCIRGRAGWQVCEKKRAQGTPVGSHLDRPGAVYGKHVGPYLPAPLPALLGSLCLENKYTVLLYSLLRKDRLPRKSHQEAALLSGPVCVPQIELCAMATRMFQEGETVRLHTHTQTLTLTSHAHMSRSFTLAITHSNTLTD